MDCISSTTTSDAAALPPMGMLSLLSNHGVHQVEHRRARRGRRHRVRPTPCDGGNEEDAAVEDGLAQDIDGGSALAEDGAGPLGGCVVGEARLDGGQRLGLVLAVPFPEVPGPPLQQVGVMRPSLSTLLPELLVGEQLEPVEDGVLLGLGVHPLVGFVEGLDGLLQDGLHPGTPLLPQATRHAHHRVGGAVAVGEHPRVEEVDAGSAPLGSARSMRRTRSARDSGTCSSRPFTRSAWGSTTTMASVRPCPRAFSLILWTTMWCMRVDLPMRVRAT